MFAHSRVGVPARALSNYQPMNLYVFQHVPYEDSGAIADWAMARGYALRTTHWYEPGAQPPHTGEVDFLVIMGGPMSVHDTLLHPWLLEEKAFLREYLATGRPVVGVCLGGQLLAQALGCEISKTPQMEIGWYPVDLTAEARALWPQLAPQLTPLHWHRETFSLPRGASLLFTNPTCVHQGFLARDNLLGLQFHIEANEASTRAIVEACPDGVIPNLSRSPFVCNARQALAGVREYSETVRAALFVMLDTIAPAASTPAPQPA